LWSNIIDKSVLESFDSKNILVTGGTGLIGRQVVDILCDVNAYVSTVSLDEVKLRDDVGHYVVDLSCFNECKRLIEGRDYVFHIAGVKGSPKVTTEKPASFLVPLLMMNTNVLEACRINKVKKVVYISSVGAYASAEVFREDENIDGPPMDSFPGAAKRIAEQQIEAYRIQYGLKNFAIVRPTNVFGPGDGFDPENAMVIPSLMARIYKGENPLVVWGDGSAIRDFAYSRDIAEGIILALYHGTGDGFVNLASGWGCSIKTLVKTLCKFIDFDYEFDASKPSGFPKRIMDITLARKLIGYQPQTTLLQGLKETWEWFVANPKEHEKKQNYFKEQ